MKFSRLLLLPFLCLSVVFSAEPLSEAFHRGLLAEESQRDPKAAAAAYGEVMRTADSQRELVATALFRLAEVKRRLGQSNEATADYRRLVRDFSEQTNLVTLAAARLPERLPAGPGVRLLEAQLEQAEQLLARTSREQGELAVFLRQTRALPTVREISGALVTRYPSAELLRLPTERNAAEVAAARLQPDFGPQHPEVVRNKAVLAKLDEQLEREITSILRTLDVREKDLGADVESQRRNVRVLEAKLAQERLDRPVSGAGLLGGNELAEGMGRLRADLRELETLIGQREQFATNSMQSLAALEQAQGAELASRLSSSYWRSGAPAELSRLLGLRQSAEREEAQLADRFGLEHPKRKEQQDMLAKLDEQLGPWRQRAIEELKWGMEAIAQSNSELKQRRDALRLRLAEAEHDLANLPVAVGLTEQRRLLMEEIKVAEEQAALLRKRFESAVPGSTGPSQNDVLQAQRDVLALKRQLAGLTRPDLLDVVVEPAPATPAPELRPRWASVGGEVKLPGALKLPDDRSMDLFEAINERGGLTTKGNPNRIQVGRGTNVFRFKLDELMTNRFELQHEDKIQVMEKVF